MPWARHVSGVQLGAPHLPGVPPPPQVCPLGQLPQSSVPPQPSPAGPHLMPCAAQVELGARAAIGRAAHAGRFRRHRRSARSGRCRTGSGCRSRRPRDRTGYPVPRRSAACTACCAAHARRAAAAAALPARAGAAFEQAAAAVTRGAALDALAPRTSSACTRAWYGCTQEPRSNSMNSSTFSCARERPGAALAREGPVVGAAGGRRRS